METKMHTPEERLFNALFGEMKENKKTEKFLDDMSKKFGCEMLKYLDEHPSELVVCDGEGNDELGKESINSQIYVLKACLFLESCPMVMRKGILKKFSDYYADPAKAWIERDENEIKHYLNEKEVTFLKKVMYDYGYDW